MEFKGYVVVDFYDGSILYDFIMDEMKICDIDFYRVVFFVNDMGENFWGVVCFKVLEEFIWGVFIDVRMNVFIMGVIVFGLLGGEMDYLFVKWEVNRLFYEVVL